MLVSMRCRLKRRLGNPAALVELSNLPARIEPLAAETLGRFIVVTPGEALI